MNNHKKSFILNIYGKENNISYFRLNLFIQSLILKWTEYELANYSELSRNNSYIYTAFGGESVTNSSLCFISDTLLDKNG
jgi:hypothetical protein